MTTQNQKYSAADYREATTAVHAFLKAMRTVETKYPSRAQKIIERIFADKFGPDTNLMEIMSLFNLQRYDVIAGRVHQADHTRALREQKMVERKHAIIETYNKMFAQAEQPQS